MIYIVIAGILTLLTIGMLSAAVHRRDKARFPMMFATALMAYTAYLVLSLGLRLAN